MKKCISVLLIMLLLVGASLPASAQISLTVDAVYDSITDAILVSGTIDAEKGMIPIVLNVTDSNGNFAAADQTFAQLDAKGTVNYAFAPVKLPYMAMGGNYTVEVSGHFIDNKKSLTVKVPGADELLTILKALSEAEKPYSVVFNNAAAFGADSKKLENLEEKGQIVYNEKIKKITYVLPEAVETDEDAIQVKEAHKTVCENLLEIIIIAEFGDISTQKELVDWLTDYYSELGFDTDSDVTEESEKALSEYVELVKNEAEFLERLTEKGKLLTTEEIQKSLYEAAALTTVSTQSDYRIINLVKTFKKFFPIGSMSDTKLTKRCEAIAGNSYDSYEEVTEALEEEKDDSSGGDSGGSGNWGSAGGKNMYVSSGNTSADSENGTEFTDLKGYEWAKEAIKALTGQKIISGRGNGIFAPQDYITRAEMIKILLLAKGISPDKNAENVFSDVEPNSWYAPYIAAAYKAGLTNGTNDGRFMPDAAVTRQDMAVLIYRAFNMSGKGVELSFDDASQIAAYAEDAVSLLVYKSVINGVGENRFAPLNAATRAQAAVMVYRAQQAK